MKFESQFNNPDKGKFTVPYSQAELEAAQVAAERAVAEAQQKAEKNKEESKLLEKQKESVRQGLEKEAPVHEITEEDIEESEKQTGKILH